MRITPLKINSEEDSKKIISSLGVDSQGIPILSPKTVNLAFRIDGIRSWEANIIKQSLLSLGSDAAINRSALIKDIKSGILVFGSVSQLRKLCAKLKGQPFSLKELSQRLSLCIDNLSRGEFVFEANGKQLRLNKPVICGIINITCDSFSGDGLLSDGRFQISDFSKRIKKLALNQAEKMIKEGARMIDIGAESSRPFSKPINYKEEIKRLAPVLRLLRKEFKSIFISVDTYKYETAKVAASEGADIINDITALRHSPGIAALIKKHKLGCVIMHMQGSPSTMQLKPVYGDVFNELIDFFDERLAFCRRSGIKDSQIFIDPGIGFGKTPEHNLKIINGIYKLKIFGLPIFIGVSRKSYIGKITSADEKDRLAGTIASNIISYAGGAKIFRVHDVKENHRALSVAQQILSQCN